MITPEITEKQKWIKKLIDYAEAWDVEWYGYVGITFDNRLIPTNNLDCDGHRYFNKKTFIRYINSQMESVCR